MPLQKVSELDHEPIVGKFYLVECIWHGGIWKPVAGPKHNDPDLQVFYNHHHTDMRFLSEREFVAPSPETQILHVLHGHYDSGKREYRKMLCKRRMPEFTPPRKTPEFYKEFQKEYRGKKACSVCPHRGMPLDSLPKREDGTIICNGHGLAIKGGVVVKRDG